MLPDAHRIRPLESKGDKVRGWPDAAGRLYEHELSWAPVCGEVVAPPIDL
jgi:hypothetical protein